MLEERRAEDLEPAVSGRALTVRVKAPKEITSFDRNNGELRVAERKKIENSCA